MYSYFIIKFCLFISDDNCDDRSHLETNIYIGPMSCGTAEECTVQRDNPYKRNAN